MPTTSAQQGTAAAPSTLIDKTTASRVFELWEQRFRDQPDTFMTKEDVARLAVADLATQAAIYFMAMLREVTDKGAPVAVLSTAGIECTNTTAAAQPGTIDQQLNTAAAVFERAFFPGREPRSDAYREGMLQTLQRRLDGTPFPPLMYTLGTAERDAYFAGMDEGNTLANTVTSA